MPLFDTPFDKSLQEKNVIIGFIVVFVLYYLWVTTNKVSLPWLRNGYVQAVIFVGCAFISERNSSLGLLVAVAVVISLMRVVTSSSESFCGNMRELYGSTQPEVPVSETQNDDQYAGDYDERPYSASAEQVEQPHYEVPYAEAREEPVTAYVDEQEKQAYDELHDKPDIEDDVLAEVVNEDVAHTVEDVNQVKDIVQSVTQQAEVETGVKLTEQKKHNILREVTKEVVDMGKKKNVYKFDVIRVCREVYKRRV